ncbi:unnamed protein product [Vicia faba]|uniref:Uncharacterized protein n=1 Tax=Vicia faba TaxID=3906 RepID=A0AAV0YLQ3_VICFA|nr:unnamed protein product [Vicia faba]
MDSSLANARNLSCKTGGKRKIEERNVGDKKDDVRGYFTWNLDMDHVLAETERTPKIASNFGEDDICVKDRANGVQVEHAFDIDYVMSKEAVVDEEGSNVHIDLEEPSSATKKKCNIVVLIKLTENLNKIVILKALPLREKKKFLLVSMP